MKRLITILAVAGVLAAAPIALAAEPLAHSGRFLLAGQGMVEIGHGEQADTVIVLDGEAVIRGTVNTLVVVDGSATLEGATLESVVAIGSSVEVGDGTTIRGELQRLDSTVHQTGHVEIGGGITDLQGVLVEAGAVLAPALILLWLGFGLATVVAALLLAGLATRQVRAAQALIGAQPLQTGLTGLAAVIVLPVLAVLFMATVIGAPLGLGLLLGILPPLAFVGYLVAGIWLGDWVLGARGPATDRAGHPYAAATVGVVILMAFGLVPILGLVSAAASLLGLGAVIRLGFQALRSPATPATVAPRAVAAPVGG